MALHPSWLVHTNRFYLNTIDIHRALKIGLLEKIRLKTVKACIPRGHSVAFEEYKKNCAGWWSVHTSAVSSNFTKIIRMMKLWMASREENRNQSNIRHVIPKLCRPPFRSHARIEVVGWAKTRLALTHGMAFCQLRTAHLRSYAPYMCFNRSKLPLYPLTLFTTRSGYCVL